MTGVKSFVLCLTIALCGNLLVGCNENSSGSDQSTKGLKSRLAQANRDRDGARMVLKGVRREITKLKTDLAKAHTTMRSALARVKPLEDEIVRLKKELAKFKAPEKGAPEPTTQPK